jgi:hypothetical protein
MMNLARGGCQGLFGSGSKATKKSRLLNDEPQLPGKLRQPSS